MPPQHRLGLHDHQGGTPLSPHGGEQNPKEAIRWTELRPFTGPRQYG